MKRCQFVLGACLMLPIAPVLAHDADPGNSGGTYDCGSIVTTVSASDFIDCSSNHRNSDDCLKWAHERKAKLANGVGAFCEREVREFKRVGRCDGDGGRLVILYHQHRGDECTVQHGCTGRDGKAPPHDHWVDVHASVQCE